MSKKRILIVDDAPIFSRRIKRVVEQEGTYDVIEENHATHAVATARACLPDLILLDVMMPEMYGGDVSSQLWANPGLNNVSIVFLTGLVSEKETHGDPVIGVDFPLQGKMANCAELLQCIEQNIRPQD